MASKNVKYLYITRDSGFCWGVRRAYKMVKDALKTKKDRMYILGDLIHNQYVVNLLETKGLKKIQSLQDIRKKNAYIVIRSHGIKKQVYDKISRMNLKIIDATCPYVKLAREKVTLLKYEGYNVIIVGDRRHSEVEGLISMVDKGYLIIEKISDIEKQKKKLEKMDKIGIIFQTTQEIEFAKKIIKKIISFYTRPKEFRVFNTLCDTTTKRQNETRIIARKVDLMIIIGGYNSANTKRLVKISSKFTSTLHIEEPDQIDNPLISRAKRIGISAGASTPQILVNRLVKKLKEGFERDGTEVIVNYS